MRFDALTPAARAVWAKSGEPSGHGLLAHMLDVAAVAERLLEREPPAAMAMVAGGLGLAVATAGRAIATAVGLHDLGKAIPGFQAKWAEGRVADEAGGLTFAPYTLAADQHDLASEVELRKLLRTQFTGLSPAVAAAVAAHHGHFFNAKQTANARRPGEPVAWAGTRSELFNSYISTLQPSPQTSGENLEASLPVLAWLAGLTSVSDWIGSNTDWFPPCERDRTLAGHHQAALRLADAALDTIGWPHHRTLFSGTADTDTLIARIVGQPGLQARPLQALADPMLLSARAPVLMIVEAPMGEGKTELALLAYLRLQAQLGHRGLYLALPTQATGNAMFDRALRFLRAFGHDQTLDLQLAHGGAMLDERLVELRGVHGQANEDRKSVV